MVSAIIRKGMLVIPNCVKQELVENKAVQKHIQGTVKAAVLEGDEVGPNLDACSVYDTKLVHFIHISCLTLRWKLNNKAVFNVKIGLMETIQFLYLNTIHNYNQKMGWGDIVDQLCGV